jgi:hypothetical protein
MSRRRGWGVLLQPLGKNLSPQLAYHLMAVPICVKFKPATIVIGNVVWKFGENELYLKFEPFSICETKCKTILYCSNKVFPLQREPTKLDFLVGSLYLVRFFLPFS